jgi:hypothetical protein
MWLPLVEDKNEAIYTALDTEVVEPRPIKNSDSIFIDI